MTVFNVLVLFSDRRHQKTNSSSCSILEVKTKSLTGLQFCLHTPQAPLVLIGWWRKAVAFSCLSLSKIVLILTEQC